MHALAVPADIQKLIYSRVWAFLIEPFDFPLEALPLRLLGSIVDSGIGQVRPLLQTEVHILLRSQLDNQVTAVNESQDITNLKSIASFIS